MKTLSPSTMIKLEIALIKVSILLTVNEIANTIIAIVIILVWSLNNSSKNAKSGITSLFADTEINPENPIKNTIGITIKNEMIKLFFNTL